MKQLAIMFFTFILTFKVYSQNTDNEYSQLIKEGWKLCLSKDYKSSAKLYKNAFDLNKKVPLTDRYNASCINALAGNKDDAFKNLFIAANELKWDDINHLKNDSDLKSLHSDNRWKILVSSITKNKEEKEKHFDKSLTKILDKIYFDDQSTRNQIRTKEKKYGRNSKEMDAFWQLILKNDSINLIKVSKILDSRGWPDKKLIGSRGSSTLFLVIQHANKETQEKYLPMVLKAVEHNNLPKRQFAMFYDRLVLRRGERQVYGTQLAINNESKKPYVLPLKDPKNVDKRRIKMGLNTMQENMNRWNLIWDIEKYIKDLPAIEAREKELNKKLKK
ncbi:DUF6624 domain-containing protein [Polaribacter ponticola]|uniref:Tetratricopeptide repeat protein n=1 Tax=Polaribacter ponticola TaxID=2978475 RepID=A0ABT5S8I3_9FLAO|nr:DUF6624 domain-containing protein [Polaribacter sp. MSW5]MDD7914424.1 hypothetical protein [Polaribacter sp. MSW5]